MLLYHAAGYDYMLLDYTVCWWSIYKCISSLYKAYMIMKHCGSWLLNIWVGMPRMREISGAAVLTTDPICVCEDGRSNVVSCSGCNRQRGNSIAGSALDRAVFNFTQILAFLVHTMRRSHLYLAFGYFGWLSYVSQWHFDGFMVRLIVTSKLCYLCAGTNDSIIYFLTIKLTDWLTHTLSLSVAMRFIVMCTIGHFGWIF